MSELALKVASQNGHTQINHCYFTSPLKLAKPFYREDGYTEAMVLVAGPGMLKGDSYEMEFEAGKDTRIMITAQSYQKLYNTAGGKTTQNVRIKVADGSSFAYIPQPVIPFNKNTFTSNMEVELEEGSKLFLADILSCGRQGMGERYLFSGFSSRLQVNVAGRPMFLDNTRLLPGQVDFDSLGFFEGSLCQGLIYLYGYGNIGLPRCENLQASASKARGGQTVRILAGSADNAHKYCLELWERLKETR